MIKRMGERDVTNHTETSAVVFFWLFLAYTKQNSVESGVYLYYYNYFSLRNRYYIRRQKCQNFNIVLYS